MKSIVVIAVASLFARAAYAGVAVEVVVTGTVVFNGIAAAPLSGVGSGETVTMSFLVDSDTFVDGVPGDVRGYAIDPSSFSLTFSGGVSQALLNPFPGTPYFGVIDGFPVSDGFFVSSSPASPGGVALAQEPYQANHSLGYMGGTLSSLDILDALGTYDFTGLTVFGLNLWAIAPDNVVMEMDFAQMTIETACVADLDGDGAVGTSDLLRLLAVWGTNPGGPPDFDGDGTVGTSDLLFLLSVWGAC